MKKKIIYRSEEAEEQNIYTDKLDELLLDAGNYKLNIS